MKSLYRRTLFFIILFILIIFRTSSMNFHDYPGNVSNPKTSRIIYIEVIHALPSIRLERLQFACKNDLDSCADIILNIFLSWKFILTSLFTVKILIIDIRRQIISLITGYFEGSRFKAKLRFSLL